MSVKERKWTTTLPRLYIFKPLALATKAKAVCR